MHKQRYAREASSSEVSQSTVESGVLESGPFLLLAANYSGGISHSLIEGWGGELVGQELTRLLLPGSMKGAVLEASWQGTEFGTIKDSSSIWCISATGSRLGVGQFLQEHHDNSLLHGTGSGKSASVECS